MRLDLHRGHRPPPATRIALLALLAILAGNSALAGPYRQGDQVEITGIVTDADGLPLSDVRVVLVAARKKFSLRRFGWVKRSDTRIATHTDEMGEYTLRWPWHRYYNYFELTVVVPVGRPGGKEELKILESTNLTERIRHGSPVVAPMTVGDTSFLKTMQEFMASVQSKDERKIYDEMGKPDRVDSVNYPDHQEVSWFYFQSGKAYRFSDGALAQVVHFDPVRPF